MTYVKKNVPVGLATENLEQVLEHGANESNYLVAASEAYVDGLKTLEIENYTSAGQLSWTIGFFLAGLAFSTVGGGTLMGGLLAI